MNYMKILILSISLLFSFHLTDAMAYKYSFKNLTSKDVEINIQGVGVIGSWMMQGKMDPKIFMRVRDAVVAINLSCPVRIQP